MLDNFEHQLKDDRRRISRRTTILIVLSIHLALTISNFSLIGQTGGPSPTGFYSHYLVYTSIPTIFIVPLLPHSLQESTGITVCFLVNGVCAAWLIGIGLHYLLYSPSGAMMTRNADESKMDDDRLNQ